SDAAASERIARHREHFVGLARLDRIEPAVAIPAGAIQVVAEGATFVLPLGEIVDLEREKARLAREIGRLDGDLAKIAAKLANPAFLAKAKPEIVDEQREREAEARRNRDRLQAAFARIAGL
ncbi:MAG: valine--tRNA ligase, partial [Stellaceae bacterium]